MEEQVAQKSNELEQYLQRVRELEDMYGKLEDALEDERRARQDEEAVRKLQERSVNRPQRPFSHSWFRAYTPACGGSTSVRPCHHRLCNPIFKYKSQICLFLSEPLHSHTAHLKIETKTETPRVINCTTAPPAGTTTNCRTTTCITSDVAAGTGAE